MHAGDTDDDVAADGIRVRRFAPEDGPLASLWAASYVLVSSGALDSRDARRAIARFSLPSRTPYVLAASHARVLVHTAAARFVPASGVGAWAPYVRDKFLAAVAEIGDPSRRAAMRARAAELGSRFSSHGAREWIWRSLAGGHAVDDRWERLTPERNRS